jgi:hypothetical protein
MKSLQFLACSIAFLIPSAALVSAAPYNTAPATPPQPLNKPPVEMQQLLTEGQTAFMKNDLATARADLQLVLELDPHNKTAIGYLRRIAVMESQQSKGGGVMEKQLQALTIPKLEFKEATLGSALDYMKKTADRLSNGKIAVSFVVQAPEAVTSTPVTLSLSNIPFTEALRYIGGVAGINFTYEKYAIVVKPNGSVEPPATAGATTPPK